MLSNLPGYILGASLQPLGRLEGWGKASCSALVSWKCLYFSQLISSCLRLVCPGFPWTLAPAFMSSRGSLCKGTFQLARLGMAMASLCLLRAVEEACWALWRGVRTGSESSLCRAWGQCRMPPRKWSRPLLGPVAVEHLGKGVWRPRPSLSISFSLLFLFFEFMLNVS